DVLDEFERALHSLICIPCFEELASSMRQAPGSLATLHAGHRVVAGVRVDKQCALAGPKDVARRLSAARRAEAIRDQVASKKSPHPRFALGGLQFDARLVCQHDVALGDLLRQTLSKRFEKLCVAMQ